MMWTTAAVFGGSFLGWYLLFSWSQQLLARYLHLQKRDMSHHHRMNVCIAAVSILQSIATSLCGISIVYTCRHDVMAAVHPMASWYAVVMIGYFVYDTLAMYEVHISGLECVPNSFISRTKNFVKRKTLLVAHHLVNAFIFCPVIVYRNGIGDFFVGCFYCAEFSSPFTNMRTVLSRFGLKASKWYLWNGIVMIVSFAICRILVFPYMYITLGNTYGLHIWGVVKKIPLHCNIGSLVALLPQLYWLWLMILGAVKLSRGKNISEADEKID